MNLNPLLNPKSSLIKNIIFDLGGVLYAIDYKAIEIGMAGLQTDKTPDGVRYSRGYQDEWFTRIEKGDISPDSFFEGLKSRFQLKDDKSAFFKIWNSMLLGLMPGRLELIQSLSQKYRLFLLSNTNAIHYDFLEPECKPLFQLFEHCYFSHEVRMRKPEPEIFMKVLQDNNLMASETLFVEDSAQHVQAADALGIHTLFVQDEHWPEQYFSDYIFKTPNSK